MVHKLILQFTQELIHCQAVESLLRISHDILRRGGMIPHGTKVRTKINSGFKQTDSFGNFSLLDI